MQLFLAGGVSGNLKPLWKMLANQCAENWDNAVEIFLAGGESRHEIIASTMHIFRAGEAHFKNERLYDTEITTNNPYILESFYYADATTEKLIPQYGDFLLDSGAFTFMMGSNGKTIKWDEYVDKYADFIKRNNVKKYFELDIDSIIGYEQVKILRNRLEKATGIQPIPVWHKSRGKEEFLRMADEYPYVALGGIVSKEWNKDEYKYFPWFINEAHKRDAKIHGLGFTNLEGLKKYHFDSVDSTSWTTGNRFGYIYQFNGETMIKHNTPQNHRLADPRKVALINFSEWVKFQKYAEVHL